MARAIKPVVFPGAGLIFIPADERSFYHRYRIKLKRPIGLCDRVLLESLVVEHDDGRLIGQVSSFRRMGGHLDGGLYRRYPSVIEKIPCPLCGALKGQLCMGSRGRWWGAVHWPRRRVRPGSVRKRKEWRQLWKELYPEIGIHEAGLDEES